MNEAVNHVLSWVRSMERGVDDADEGEGVTDTDDCGEVWFEDMDEEGWVTCEGDGMSVSSTTARHRRARERKS